MTEALVQSDSSPATYLPVDLIKPSPLNPAGRTKGPEFDEFVASVRTHGILVPILVRPVKTGYEAVAGHRRLAAAREANLAVIPAIARELSDEMAIELQLVENLQRSDIHPLDEAEGYRLLRAKQFSVVHISEKIGRTVAYVYDRLNLGNLLPELKKDFRDDLITTGHAVVLARLSAADQKRALKDTLYEAEQGILFDPEAPDVAKTRDPLWRYQAHTKKAISVRELQSWVNKHVRFDPSNVDPMLFPDTALALEGAPKVIPITTENYIPDEARTKERTFFPASWKRADGQRGSKTCEYSVLGFVAIGARKGSAFLVCTAKDRCQTHWAREIKERKSAAKRREPRATAPGNQSHHPKNSELDDKFQKALEIEDRKAREEIKALVAKAAGALSNEDALRLCLRTVDEYELRDYLRKRGVKQESSKWLDKATPRELKEALGVIACDLGDEVLKLLGINVEPIWKAAKQRAKASVAGATAQTAAATPTTKPTKTTKAKKRSR